MDSGVYAALCHTRRHLYGPVASSKSPTFDYLSIWARRAEGEDKQEQGPCQEPVTENSKTVKCWENLGMAAAAWATSARLQALTAASNSADIMF